MGPATPPTVSGSVLHTALDDGVLSLALDRPEARNALSPDLVEALDSALDRLEEDPAVRAGVITGAGSAFCAGLDVKVFAAAAADRRTVSALLRRFGRLGKPLVGAVNGPAVAGGLEIALACDFLVASPRAVFADTHVRIGAFPGGGLTARLGRAVGVRTAQAMSLAGLRLDAPAALRAGLVTEVVEADHLLGRATELAAAVSAADPDLVRAVCRLHGESTDRSLPAALAEEAAALQHWRTGHRTAWSVAEKAPTTPPSEDDRP